MPKSKKMPRVFVVDDEPVIAGTVAAILNREGFAAVPFTNPFEALKAARISPPDLLISDVKMPELSGVELAVALWQACPECKILLFSGQASSEGLLSKARRQGYKFHLLQKPVHPKDLLRKLRLNQPISSWERWTDRPTQDVL